MHRNKICKCTEAFDEAREVCTKCAKSRLDLAESTQVTEAVKVSEPDQQFREAVLNKDSEFWKTLTV
jgi:hypothetical protein